MMSNPDSVRGGHLISIPAIVSRRVACRGSIVDSVNPFRFHDSVNFIRSFVVVNPEISRWTLQ